MKKLKPTTPGRRGTRTVEYRKVLTTAKPKKKLVKGQKKRAGRASHGKISVRHKGGGHKRKVRKIDFKYDKKDIPAKVKEIEYDPHRSGFIALICYADGEYRYILAPAELKKGDKITVSKDASVKVGNRIPLKKIPAGTFVYNVEIQPEGGSKLGRSAGNHVEVLGSADGFTTLKMPSSEIRKVNENSWASIGAVSNPEHGLKVLGKAGRSRWMGKRPTVRGSAMNPVDHPHGGGEGRAGRGHRRQRTKWGKPSGKGQKTRKAKKYSNVMIIKRRKAKKRK